MTVRRLRSERGIAQEQLALICDIDRSFMGRIERGIHAPTFWTIYKLLPGLGVSLRCFTKHFEEALAIVMSKDWKR